MNKYLQGCLYVLGAISLIILVVCGIVYYHISTSRQRNERDDTDCANTQKITDNPVVVINDSLHTKNVDQISIILIQNAKKIDSAVLANTSDQEIVLNIPFEKINLSDKILIKTETQTFIVENLRYYNDAKWGMFGYLGKNCQLQYDWRISK